mgnify:FL=1
MHAATALLTSSPPFWVCGTRGVVNRAQRPPVLPRLQAAWLAHPVDIRAPGHKLLDCLQVAVAACHLQRALRSRRHCMASEDVSGSDISGIMRCAMRAKATSPAHLNCPAPIYHQQLYFGLLHAGTTACAAKVACAPPPDDQAWRAHRVLLLLGVRGRAAAKDPGNPRNVAFSSGAAQVVGLQGAVAQSRCVQLQSQQSMGGCACGAAYGAWADPGLRACGSIVSWCHKLAIVQPGGRAAPAQPGQ